MQVSQALSEWSSQQGDPGTVVICTLFEQALRDRCSLADFIKGSLEDKENNRMLLVSNCLAFLAGRSQVVAGLMMDYRMIATLLQGVINKDLAEVVRYQLLLTLCSVAAIDMQTFTGYLLMNRGALLSELMDYFNFATGLLAEVVLSLLISIAMQQQRLSVQLMQRAYLRAWLTYGLRSPAKTKETLWQLLSHMMLQTVANGTSTDFVDLLFDVGAIQASLTCFVDSQETTELIILILLFHRFSIADKTGYLSIHALLAQRPVIEKMLKISQHDDCMCYSTTLLRDLSENPSFCQLAADNVTSAAFFRVVYAEGMQIEEGLLGLQSCKANLLQAVYAISEKSSKGYTWLLTQGGAQAMGVVVDGLLFQTNYAFDMALEALVLCLVSVCHEPQLASDVLGISRFDRLCQRLLSGADSVVMAKLLRVLHQHVVYQSLIIEKIHSCCVVKNWVVRQHQDSFSGVEALACMAELLAIVDLIPVFVKEGGLHQLLSLCRIHDENVVGIPEDLQKLKRDFLVHRSACLQCLSAQPEAHQALLRLIGHEQLLAWLNPDTQALVTTKADDAPASISCDSKGPST